MLQIGIARIRLLLWALMVALTSVAIGCNREGDVPADDPVPASDSDWRAVNGTTVLAVPQGQDDTELQDAIREARATADKARERWTYESPEQRRRWSVKWAAPRAEGGVEHVWVQPQHWSAFRIEGVLLSRPIAQLACGKTQGDPVSFPIEELSDWVRTLSDDPQGPFEGGFTIKALEERHGEPG